jgi:hypothetical protein
MSGPVDAAAMPAPTHAADAPSRRRRVSRVLVPLGFLVTALVIPAFTRQWDDRQKAQELKASLVRRMAAATTSALVSHGDVTFGKGPDSLVLPPSSSALTSTVKDWERSSFAIESELSTFLGQGVLERWQAYNTQMELFFIVLGNPTDEKNVEELALRLGYSPGQAASKAQDAVSTGLGANTIREQEYIDFNTALVGSEQDVARAVLVSHVNGYSTDFADFLRDLRPPWP